MKQARILALLALLPVVAFGKHPDCSGTGRWPTNMAFGHLKNAKITDNDKLDFGKTKTSRLTSQQIGKDLYRQVHHVAFTEKSGETIEVITVSDASHQECSMSAVDVYVIKEKIGGR